MIFALYVMDLMKHNVTNAIQTTFYLELLVRILALMESSKIKFNTFAKVVHLLARNVMHLP